MTMTTAKLSIYQERFQGMPSGQLIRVVRELMAFAPRYSRTNPEVARTFFTEAGIAFAELVRRGKWIEPSPVGPESRAGQRRQKCQLDCEVRSEESLVARAPGPFFRSLRSLIQKVKPGALS